MADFYDIILKFELALPFILLSLYLSIVVLGRKKKDKKSLQKLITLYKEKEEGRKKTVIEFLKNKVGLDEPASEETSKKILQARKSFLQKIISAFLTRKEDSVANLDNELSLITRAYQELSITVEKEEVAEEAKDEIDEPQPPTESEPAEPDGKVDDELARLKKENKNLKIELHTTSSTLNNIFAEYTSMFGEETDRKDMSVDEILTAMESFGNDQVAAATSSDASAEEVMSEVETKSEAIIDTPDEEPVATPEPEVKPEEPVATPEPEVKPEEPAAEPEPEVKPEEPVAAPEPEAKPEEPVAAPEPEVKPEEPAAEPEPEAKPDAKSEESTAEAEPSWDEAFEEAEAKPEAKPEESTAEAEPSWDEAFAEMDDKEESKDSKDGSSDDTSDDGWGDDKDKINEIDDNEEDDMQPEWGNAMEDELVDPDKEDKK